MTRPGKILLHICFSLGIDYFEISFLICLYMFLQQETPDFVNSLSLKVEIEQQNAYVNPVLDKFSPNASEFFVSDCYSMTSCVTFILKFGRQRSLLLDLDIEFEQLLCRGICTGIYNDVCVCVCVCHDYQIPFTKDCGSDDVCISDLVLSVKTDTKTSRWEILNYWLHLQQIVTDRGLKKIKYAMWWYPQNREFCFLKK